MSSRALLAGCDIGVSTAHFAAAPAAIPNLHRITADFGPRLGRDVCDRYNFPFPFAQCPTTARTTRNRDRHIYRLRVCHLLRRVAEPEETLARLAPRRFGIRFARAFGKRGGPTSAFQLLDF